MLKKFFIKRAIRNSISDAGKMFKREVRLVKKGAHDLGKTIAATKMPIKLKVK